MSIAKRSLPAADSAGGHPVSQELILALLVAGEIALFAWTGKNFFTTANAFEIARASVEIGLLALALTAVILTGGIDLSVGSLLGLSAVLMGAAWKDGGLPMGLAALLAVAVGVAGGASVIVFLLSVCLSPKAMR
jgi:rhamnose transport system permease protein